MRLLAVDQHTDDQNNQPAVAKNATLEVTPGQAEAITMLVDMGRLSLSLRSLGRNSADAAGEEPIQNVAQQSYTLDTQVSALLDPAPAPAPKKGKAPARAKAPRPAPIQQVSVVRGSASQALTFSASGQAAQSAPPTDLKSE